jgi:hypothetical protein
MRKLILAVSAAALIAAPGLTFAATAPASAPTKTAPKYDCTKKGNAKKAACKAAAVPAASTTMAGAPAATTTATTPAKLAGQPATAVIKTTTTAAGGNMKACATQWDALSATQKDAYKTQATGMKSKSGGKLSGYNVFTGECLKKK